MDNESKLIFEQYLEESWKKGTSKAPKGKSFDMSRGGAPSNVDAARDGSGGRYRKTRPPSAQSNKTHGEMEEDIPEEDDMGLGPNTPMTVTIAAIGNTKPFRKGAGAPIRQSSDEEHVYIQAGETDEQGDDCGCEDDCGCDQREGDVDYDGELDMARAELLKAADYAVKLFNHIENVDNLEGWTASKITKAADYLSSVFHYMEYEALNANVEDHES